MGWLIITLIAIIVIAACVVGFFVSSKGEDKAINAGIAVVVLIIWAIISAFMSIHTVGQREVGVVKSFSGKLTGRVNSGVVWVPPWSSVLTENIGIQREDFHLDESNAAVSLDQQPIFADLSLNYQVEPSQVLTLFRRVGPNWKAVLLDSRVLQDFKEVTAQYTAAQITTKRAQLRQDTKTRLAAELSKYDILVVDFFVKNLGYTNSYRNAINAKNVQVQQSLQAQAKVAQATAEANQNIAIAKGNAEAIRLKGQALRRNPEVLTLEAIDKLNPNAQVIICTGTGSQNCPSFLPNFSTVGK